MTPEIKVNHRIFEDAEFSISEPTEDGNCFLVPLEVDASPLTIKNDEDFQKEGA